MELSKYKKYIKGLLVASALFLIPSVVSAAPVVGLVASALASTGAISALTAAVITFAASVVQSVYGASQARKAAKAAAQAQKDAYNANLQDRTITAVSAEDPYRYIYGTSRVGSTIVAMFTSGDKDQYRHIVCVHAAHECDSVVDYYVNDIKVGNRDSNGDVIDGTYAESYTKLSDSVTFTDTVTFDHDPLKIIISTYKEATNNQGSNGGWFSKTYKPDGTSWSDIFAFDDIDYNPITRTLTLAGEHKAQIEYTYKVPRLRIKTHLGIPNDPADASLINEIAGSKWTADHKLTGLCYSVIRLDLNYSDFQSGLIPIEVVLKGKKVYDPRTGVTVWSENPALCVRDYLTSPICNIDETDLPDVDFITAANVCDEVFSFGKRYTLNGVITSDQSQADVLESMCRAMAGTIVATTWHIQAGKYVAPIASFTQEDIVGDLEISSGISDADIYNGVTGQYVSSENNYVATDFKPYQNSTYLAVDGRDKFNDLTFEFTNTVQRVHNIARIYTEDHRNAFTIAADFNLKAWNKQVGDRVLFTSTFLGQSNKVYRITDKSLNPSGTIKLTLKEDDPTIWDFADTVVADQTPNTNLENPFTNIPSVNNLVADSGTDVLYIASDGTIKSRLLVSWDSLPTSDKYQIELGWKLDNDLNWSTVYLDTSTTSYYVNDVIDGQIYNIRARVGNPYLNAGSNYSYLTNSIIGKSQPPSDITTFNIDNNVLIFSEVSDLDLAGYLIRFNYGNNTDWNSASSLHSGVLTSSPYSPSFYPSGNITILIKAIDTSGNVSENVAVIYKDFGDRILSNLILSYDDKATGWSGTKSGCSVTSGNLVADFLSGNFWFSDADSHFRLNGANYFSNSIYNNVEYILYYAVQPSEIGSSLSIDLAITADSYNIEYRYTTNGLNFGADVDNYWGLDSALYYPASGDWLPWSGVINSVSSGELQFRITIPQSTTQSVISGLVLNFDVEDEYEELDNVSISATGTRLPITKSYRSINNIQLTLQDNATGAISAMWVDKDPVLGALIYCYNAAGTKVAGVIDARIQGVKGL